MSLLLLAACLQRPTVDPGTPTTGATTGTTATTITGGTTGGTTGTGGTTPEGPFAVGMLVPVEGADLPDRATVSLMRFHLEDMGGETIPVLDDALAWALAGSDGSFAVPLPDAVPDEDFQEVDPKNFPGLELAVYLVMAHPDEDGDGQWVEGDPAWGTSLSGGWALARGGSSYGLEDGWYTARFEGSDTTLVSIAERVEVVLRGLEASVHAEGVSAAPEPYGVHEGFIGVVSDPTSIVIDPSQAAYDVLLYAGAWAQDLEDPPRETFRKEEETTGLVYASFFNLVYDDLDASETYSDPVEMDPLSATICWDERPVTTTWFATPTTYLGLVSLEMAGWHAGWLLIVQDESGAPLVLDQAMAGELVLDRKNCSLL